MGQRLLVPWELLTFLLRSDPSYSRPDSSSGQFWPSCMSSDQISEDKTNDDREVL